MSKPDTGIASNPPPRRRAVAVARWLLAGAASGIAAAAAEWHVYVSASPRTGPAGIYRGAIDVGRGTARFVLAAPAPGANFLALSPDGARLYASMGAAGVAAFAIGDDGSPALVNQRASGGMAVHVSLTPDGRTVLVANFDNGTVAAFPVEAGGGLGERTGWLQFTGSGPRLPRQAHARPHAIYPDATGTFALVPDLGADRVWVVRLDPRTHTLTRIDIPDAAVAPGAGPRHLALHPGGRFVYVNNEMTPGLATFAREPGTGALTLLGTQAVFPPDTKSEGTSTAEIFLHPHGRFLQVSTRGNNGIASYRVEDDGSARWLAHTPVPVRGARSFALTPDGDGMVIAGEGDGRIAVARLDRATGLPHDIRKVADVPGSNCVIFAPPREGPTVSPAP
jgi:6-phosphogluconolactonase